MEISKPKLNNKAQTSLEMALFGSLILIAMVALFSYSQKVNDQQYVAMDAFRKAEASAYSASELGGSASYQIIEHRRNIAGDLFREGSRSPVSGGASVLWGKMNVTEIDVPDEKQPKNAKNPKTHKEVDIGEFTNVNLIQINDDMYDLSPFYENDDFDNDGIPNRRDDDDDNDGILDVDDPDDDNDGRPDDFDDVDNDGIPNGSDPDDDNDGILDVEDPDDDNDGIPDEQDNDDDNDGIPDYVNDIDHDGIPNIADPDDDNDGILDAADPDDDNNGIPDADDLKDDDDGDDDESVQMKITNSAETDSVQAANKSEDSSQISTTHNLTLKDRITLQLDFSDEKATEADADKSLTITQYLYWDGTKYGYSEGEKTVTRSIKWTTPH